MEDEPINQNYLIGCDTIENSPSNSYDQAYTCLIHFFKRLDNDDSFHWNIFSALKLLFNVWLKLDNIPPGLRFHQTLLVVNCTGGKLYWW